MRRWLSEMREGVRILSSGRFWKDFRTYWSRDAMASRMEAWLERVRDGR